MKAWQVYGINDMRLEEVSIPEPKPGWFLAKLKTFQASITEIQRFRGISQRGLSTMKEMIRSIGPFPMGHEICAEVDAVWDSEDLRVGDRIAYFHFEHKVAGSHYPGCFAEYALLPVNTAVKIDSEVSDIEAPALQPFSSCVQAVREADIQLGETVAVFGQGVMGMNITQLCRLAGAKQVIGVDVRDQCLKIAAELGADATINSDRQDPVQTIHDLTEGRGADVVFECASGDPQVGLSGGKTFFDALGAVRRYGRVIQIAFFHEKITLDPNMLRARRIKYIFPSGATRADMELGIHLLSRGKVCFKPGITHVLNGIETLPEAFDITADKTKYGAINPAVVVVSG